MNTFFSRWFHSKSRPTARTFRPSVEGLDDRNLLSGGPLAAPAITATLQLGVLKVVGTNLDDNITLKQSNGKITVAGVSGFFPVAAVTRIEVQGLGGKDWIRLDSETLGGQPITKPSVIRGGAGDDLIMGGYGADQLFGEAGDDILHGSPGKDLLDGGAGRDTAFGGADSDIITADFADALLAGQAGADSTQFTKLDPAPLVGNNSATMKTAIQSGLDGVSFSKTKNGFKFTVSELKIETITIESGLTTLAMRAKVNVKQYVFGQQVASSTGTLKFTLQPQVSITFAEALVQKATIGLANVKVKEMNLNNVPNWIDNNSEVRDFLEAKIAALPAMNYTSQVQLFLALGGSLGPTVQA